MLLANARDKLQGFKELFCDKKLDFQGLDIEVALYYYNKESSVPKDLKGILFHRFVSYLCKFKAIIF